MKAIKAKSKVLARPDNRPAQTEVAHGAAVLVSGEHRVEYQALADRIKALVSPADALEEIFFQDIVYLTWEVHRLRRLKAKYMQAAAHEGLERALKRAVPILVERDRLIEGWVRRDPESVEKVETVLHQCGLDMEHITAETLAARIETFEKIDRMITVTEARRGLALKELERHRSSLAKLLRAAAETIEDGEFQDVSGPPQGPK